MNSHAFDRMCCLSSSGTTTTQSPFPGGPEEVVILDRRRLGTGMARRSVKVSAAARACVAKFADISSITNSPKNKCY